MIVTVLGPKLIKLLKISESVGTIHGTHIAIKELANHYADFTNQKRYYSVNAEVVCDHKYCFLNVVVTWPVSVHDSNIFLNSSINKKFCNGTILPCKKEIISGVNEVSACLLGDPACSLVPIIMKKYAGGA